MPACPKIWGDLMAQTLSNTDTSFASPHIPIWIRKKGFSIGKVKLEIMFKKFILPKVDMSWFCLLCMAWMFLPLTAKCNKHFSPYGSFACYYIYPIFICSQVHLLGRLHHRNLVNLVGYCAEKGQHMLIYVYMSKGSLASHLYGKLAINSLYFILYASDKL